MILGRGLFVSPGDSLAMLAANLQLLPGYRDGVRGIARSMPTCRAADQVSKALNVPLHKTPPGWKFFCHLLAAGEVAICGDEIRSAEHTYELQALMRISYAVCCLKQK